MMRENAQGGTTTTTTTRITMTPQQSQPVQSQTGSRQAGQPQTAVPAQDTGPVYTSKGFWVELAGYTSLDLANTLVAGVRQLGVSNVQIFTTNAGGAVYYRVRVGPYSTQAKADAARRALMSAPYNCTTASVIYLNQ
jgi:cell division septation protein DedD